MFFVCVYSQYFGFQIYYQTIHRRPFSSSFWLPKLRQLTCQPSVHNVVRSRYRQAFPKVSKEKTKNTNMKKKDRREEKSNLLIIGHTHEDY